MVETQLDLGTIKLVDIIDIACLQQLQNDFAQGVGMASIIVDLEGKPITKPSYYTKFCMHYTHGTEYGDQRCAQSHKRGGEEATRLGKPVLYECHAGLIDFAAPIILEGRQIATILGGQVLTAAPDEEKYRKIAQEIGVDEDGYSTAVKEIRILSKANIQAAANILGIVANNILKIEYKKQKVEVKSHALSDKINKISASIKEVATSVKAVSAHQGNVGKMKKNVDFINHKMDEMMMLSKNITEIVLGRKVEMTRLDRLNLIGEMATSIGHEVRNPLTTVRGFLQFFYRKPEFSKYASNLDIMIEELDRANEIITDFLLLAKNRTLDFKLLDLNQVITKIEPLLQAKGMIKKVQIQCRLDKVPPLLLDEKEMGQLIANLVANAIEATTQYETVTISTCTRDEQLCLTISDTGCGIPHQHLEQIGTPFFSTKSQGTGLGLAVCYRIADRHSAAMRIHSEEGVGTEVEILFHHSRKDM